MGLRGDQEVLKKRQISLLCLHAKQGSFCPYYTHCLQIPNERSDIISQKKKKKKKKKLLQRRQILYGVSVNCWTYWVWSRIEDPVYVYESRAIFP